MTDPFQAMLAKLEEHRADPLSAVVAGELHQLVADAPHLAAQLLDHAFGPAAPPAPAAALPVAFVEGPAPGLPPELAPPATNWGTNQRLDGAQQARQPVDVAQVKGVLALATGGKLRAKAIGTAHSSSAVFTTRGVLVDSGALIPPGTTANTSTLRQCRELSPGLYRLGEAARALHVEVGSGVQVKDVNAYLAASSRALAMTGAYTGQTLVGAFCTSTHGAGVQHPPLHAAVRSIQLVTVDEAGAVVELRIEPTLGITDPALYARIFPDVKLVQDDAWFRAAVVAMGTMGFITSVIIEVVDAFSLLNESWLGTWEACRALLLDTGADGLPRWFEGTYHGGVSFNPYPMPLFARGTQKATMGRTFLRPTPPAEYDPPSQSGLSPWLVCAARFVGNDIPALTPIMIDQALGGAPGKPIWGPSWQVLGSPDNLPPGFSAEYAFPMDRYLSAIDTILARMNALAAQDATYMVGPVTLRWVGKDTAFLSMSAGEDRVYAEFLTLAGAGKGQEVLAEIEKIALDHGGRPHWGQWFSPAVVPRMAGMYPEYPRWKAIYDRLNVTGVFSNEITDRLP